MVQTRDEVDLVPLACEDGRLLITFDSVCERNFEKVDLKQKHNAKS